MGKNKDESYTDFCETLSSLGGGAVNDKLSEKLAEITKAVREHSKAGTITLKLTIKPEGQIGQMVGLTAKVTSAKPEPSMPGAIYFASEEGTLHVDDPRQLKLRTLPTPQAAIPMRSVAATNAKPEPETEE